MLHKQIFIIDDDNHYIKLLSKILLQNHSYNIRGYDNAYIAIEELNKYKPDIIILDHDMPRITGLELLKKYSESLLNTNLIVISGNTNIQKEFQSLGVNYFLSKPLEVNKFLETINHF
jgi:DNA-binding NtrC family response regulator